MSLGQIRMCGRPQVGAAFVQLQIGGFVPAMAGQSRRPVPLNLMPKCAPSAVPGRRYGLTLAARDPFEESFSKVIDADNVEHRPFGHPRSGCLSPTFALAGPCIGFVALLASPVQSKNACLPLVRSAIFRSPGHFLPRTLGMSRKLRQCALVPQVLRPSIRATTLLARHSRTIVPRYLKPLKAAMP